jgi:hypothetical protein
MTEVSEVYGSREVSIVSPYDPSVGALVLEESVPAWLANGWTLGTPEAPAPESDAAPSDAPAQAAAAPGVVVTPDATVKK